MIRKEYFPKTVWIYRTDKCPKHEFNKESFKAHRNKTYRCDLCGRGVTVTPSKGRRKKV